MMMGASRATSADVVGDRDAGVRKLGASRRVDVEADHAPAALDQVAGDRASHDAKPDDSNGLVHAAFPPCRSRIWRAASAAP